MTSENNPGNIALTITFTDPDLDAEKRNEEAVKLFKALKDRSEIEAVERVRDPNPPEGNKGVGSFLVGMLMAQVTMENAKKALGFLGDRLGNKQITIEAEVNGIKMKVSAASKEEVAFAIEQTDAFIEKYRV
jgi:hypothetical protein